jgi:hypothetical protein
MENQKATVQVYQFEWQGMIIEARYTPVKWRVISHLEIVSIAPERAPLPISMTGYQSYWPQIGSIEEQGGDVIAIVTAWLDEEAKGQDWRDYLENQRQYSLF